MNGPAARPAPATGGCLCGAVHFSVPGAFVSARACWCRLCQYIGAGGATVNALYSSDGFDVIGETRDFVSVADSGTVMHRFFCPTCGTHLYGTAESRPHIVVVRVGALDDPATAPPASTIWTAEAPGWACFDPALPSLDGQPAPPPAPRA
ncbi:MAG: GFA family protein [Sphingomonas sp.]